MAETTNISPQAGGLNFADYQEKIQKAAASTRATGEVDTSILKKATSGLTGTNKGIGQAAVQNYQNQAGHKKL